MVWLPRFRLGMLKEEPAPRSVITGVSLLRKVRVCLDLLDLSGVALGMSGHEDHPLVGIELAQRRGSNMRVQLVPSLLDVLDVRIALGGKSFEQLFAIGKCMTGPELLRRFRLLTAVRDHLHDLLFLAFYRSALFRGCFRTFHDLIRDHLR